MGELETVENVENEVIIDHTEPVELTPEQQESAKVSEKEKARNRLSDRNKILTFQAREAQREAALLKAENEELKKATLLKKEPDPDDYADHDKLQNDLKQWKMQEENRIRQDERNRVRQESTQEKQQRENQERGLKWAAQQQKELAEDKDYLSKEKIVVNKLKEHAEFIDSYSASNVRNLINDTDNGTKIVAYFNSHPDKLEDILYLSPIKQLKAIADIETEVKAKSPKKISSAPAPIESVKGSATVQKDLSKETQEEYNRRINFGK